MSCSLLVGSPTPFSLALQNEPWELDPGLAQTLIEALQLDPETLANEAEERAANVARTAASSRATQAMAEAARATFHRVVSEQLMTPDWGSDCARPRTQGTASAPDPTDRTAAQPQGATPGTALASVHMSQMLVSGQVVALDTPAASCTQPQKAPQAPQVQAVGTGPCAVRAFSQAPWTSERAATRPLPAFLSQSDSDVSDFNRPTGISGVGFPRPKRPALVQEAATQGPSAASAVPLASPAWEGPASGPKAARSRSGKALAKTWWMEPQKVAEAASAKALMAPGLPQQAGAASSTQHSAEPWVSKGGKRTKKVRDLPSSPSSPGPSLSSLSHPPACSCTVSLSPALPLTLSHLLLSLFSMFLLRKPLASGQMGHQGLSVWHWALSSCHPVCTQLWSPGAWLCLRCMSAPLKW